MNKRVNLPFLAYLAYLAGLLTLSVVLSSCSTTGARYGAAYDDMTPRKCGKTSQTFRNW